MAPSGWQMTRAIGKATRFTSLAATSALESGLFGLNGAIGRASDLQSVLGPGARDPQPGTGDFYDYRGVARPRELRQFEAQPFSLGAVIDASGRRRSYGIGLPLDYLRRHAAVIGSTGSGKTKSVLVPWMASALRLGCTVIATDISGDLTDDLDRHRAATGPFNAIVGRWDYAHPSTSLSWNWMGSLADDEAILAAVEALNGREKPNDSQPFFHQRDGRYLRGLLELMRWLKPDSSGRNLLWLLRDQAALSAVITAHANHPGAQRLHDLLGRKPDEYSQSISGVINALEVWDHPGLAAVTSRSELDLDALLERPSLLVVGAAIHGGRTSEVTSSLLLSQIIQRLYKRFQTTNPRPVLLVIDEAARIANRIPLEELLSVGRRAGVMVVFATQDVGQIRDENERLSILGNCATYVGLPGPTQSNSDYLTRRLGSRRQSAQSLGRSYGSSSGRTRSQHIEDVPVLGVREIQSPPWGPRTAVVHSTQVSAKPFLVDLTRQEFV